MRIDFTSRYTLIVKLLKSGSKSFDEIQSHVLNKLNLSNYSIRTFQRDVIEIEIIYGITIKCTMGRGFTKTIERITTFVMADRMLTFRKEN